MLLKEFKPLLDPTDLGSHFLLRRIWSLRLLIDNLWLIRLWGCPGVHFLSQEVPLYQLLLCLEVEPTEDEGETLAEATRLRLVTTRHTINYFYMNLRISISAAKGLPLLHLLELLTVLAQRPRSFVFQIRCLIVRISGSVLSIFKLALFVPGSPHIDVWSLLVWFSCWLVWHRDGCSIRSFSLK